MTRVNGNGAKITDVHIAREIILEPPALVAKDIPTTPELRAQVARHRVTIENILHGHDQRFLLIAGPCSMFNKKGTLEFAEAFRALSERVSDKMFLIMRSPPDKPRTISKSGQWEGMLHEPNVVGTHDPVVGIRRTREILRDIADMGIPLAIELLDTRRTQYVDDILSLSWTGARAVEYGALRRQASGLSWPTGFKNRTDGTLKPAYDAIESANHANYFDGMNKETGQTTVEVGTGNPNAFLIMRGSEQTGGRNYYAGFVEAAQKDLRERKLLDFVVVDSAHGNSLDDKGKKDHRRQLVVFESILEQRLRGGNTRIGAMVEAYLKEGKQDVLPGTELASLPYDISPTDPTISISQFETLVLDAHAQLPSAEAKAA